MHTLLLAKLIKEPAICIRNTLTYQNNCRNTLGFLMGQGYRATNLDVMYVIVFCVHMGEVFQNSIVYIYSNKVFVGSLFQLFCE